MIVQTSSDGLSSDSTVMKGFLFGLKSTFPIRLLRSADDISCGIGIYSVGGL